MVSATVASPRPRRPGRARRLVLGLASAIAVLAAAWVWLVPQVLAQQARRILANASITITREP